MTLFESFSWDEISKILKKSLDDNLEGIIALLPNLLAGIVVLFLFWIISLIYKLVAKRIITKLDLRESLRDLILNFGKVLVWVFGFLVVATIIFPGLTPSKVLGAAGLASVAVGLAFKDIFQNFFAGIILLWRFPFEPGDFIECGDVRGRVIDTRLRMTTVRDPGGELVIIPNSKLVENSLEVLTDQDLRRTSISTGVAYKEDLEAARRIIEETMNSCSSVDQSKPRDVFATGFGESSMDMEILYWTNSQPYQMRESRSEVIIAVKEALDNAGIEIPFPYRTLTFDKPVTVENASA